MGTGKIIEMIKELAIKFGRTAIKCRNMQEAYKILDICEKESIIFTKGKQHGFGFCWNESIDIIKEEYLDNLPKNCKPILLIVKIAEEFQFYCRCQEEYDYYKDWNFFHFVEFSFFREQKLKRLLK